MRSAPLLLLIALTGAGALAQGPDAKTGPGRVEGRAINLKTGAPLKKVTVWLKPSMVGGSVNEGHSGAVRSTTSDAEGRFSFDGLEAGAYVLSGRRNGYLEQGYGARSPLVPGAPFRVDAGQILMDVVLKLAPQGMLFGKVTDEDGDPLPNAQVQVARIGYAGGSETREVSEVSTQDDGSYVIGNLVPGRYRVSAQTGQDDEWMAGAESREAYVPTYYPNTTDRATAGPVEVGPGAEVRGLNIRLARIPVYRVSGRVVDAATGQPAGNTSLQLLRAGEEGTITKGVTVGSDGAFQFRRLLPGDYWLQSSNDTTVVAFDRETGTAMRERGRLVGRVPLHIGQEDIDGLVVPLGSGAELRGAIRVDGAAARIPGGLQLELMPVDGEIRNAVIAPVGRDGMFHAGGIMPQHYTIAVGGLRDGLYVRSVRSGNQDVTHLPVELNSASPAAMEIVLSPNGAEVRGVVRGPGGAAMPGAAVRVWGGDATVYPATADENGGFRVSGLEPGEYRIFAWEDPDPALTIDAAMRNAFGGHAVSVKLGERAKETVDVRLISRETVDSELSKIR